MTPNISRIIKQTEKCRHQNAIKRAEINEETKRQGSSYRWKATLAKFQGINVKKSLRNLSLKWLSMQSNSLKSNFYRFEIFNCWWILTKTWNFICITNTFVLQFNRFCSQMRIFLSYVSGNSAGIVNNQNPQSVKNYAGISSVFFLI